jgi:glycerol-3-phosphate dehydrogenase (NAD(P)+)
MGKNGAETAAYDHIGVIGAGAWGTALAIAAARAGRRVSLWAREHEVIASISNSRVNAQFLPDVALPDTIHVTGDIEVAAAADALLLVSPAQYLRSTLSLLAVRSVRDKPVVACAKGIERGTGKLMTEVLTEFLELECVGVLSGPSFARDVANNLPTAVTIAAKMDVAQRLQDSLGHASFRPYATDDITGVALGGAAKNVYAIACGIVMGMGLGESARAALLARSFAELRRLGVAIGAKPETLMGLSGLGDLVLTATSSTSRNFSFGAAIGKGVLRSTLEQQAHPLAEGVETAPALAARAKQHSVELPIAEATAAILDGSLALDAAIPHLMARPLKPE